MLTYADLEKALKHVPVEHLPEIYEFILTYVEWPFEASPEALDADDRQWEAKFASAESQQLFARMAAEVRGEIAAGKVKPLEHLLAEEKADYEVEDDASI